MKCLLDELSENECSFQDCHSPFANIEKRHTHEVQHETVKTEYFNSLMFSFQSNLMSSVASLLTSGLSNMLTQFTIQCKSVFQSSFSTLKFTASQVNETGSHCNESAGLKKTSEAQSIFFTKTTRLR